MRTHILGFPSIGKARELKRALESFWQGQSDAAALDAVRRDLEARHWGIQQAAGLDMVVCGDFSFYDRMLDTTLMLGALPARFAPCAEDAPLGPLLRPGARPRGTQPSGSGNDQVV